MGRMNWDKVRAENLCTAHGSEYADILVQVPAEKKRATSAPTPKSKRMTKCPRCLKPVRNDCLSEHEAQRCPFRKTLAKAAGPKTTGSAVLPRNPSQKTSAPPLELIRQLGDSLRLTGVGTWTLAELVAAQSMCNSAAQYFAAAIRTRRG